MTRVTNKRPGRIFLTTLPVILGIRPSNLILVSEFFTNTRPDISIA